MSPPPPLPPRPVSSSAGERVDLLARRAVRSADHLALVDAATGDRWTYGELDAAVDRTARGLVAAGLAPGDHLAVLLATRPAAVRLLFAAARLGATLVPLHPELTPAEVGRALHRADADALACGATTEETAVEAVEAVAGTDAAERLANSVVTVDEPAADATALADAFTGGDRVAEERADAVPDDPGLRPTDTQLLVSTSGTTGTPKLVRLTPRNLRASAVNSALRLGIDPADRWYSPLSTAHVGGLAPVLRSTLYGTTTVFARSFDADEALEHLRTFDCTATSLVPTMLRRVLDATDGTAPGGLPGSLRFVLLGGAPASADLLERCREAGVPACPTYGLTEAASQVATALPDETAEYPGTVGTPLFDTDVTVVGGDGEPVPPGETGEVVVDGPTVTPGYYGDTTAPVGEYGLHTGDVGTLRDGRLWIFDRLSDRIVTGGENVDPGEVVAVLSDHPGVETAAVVGLPDPEWGERVAALVVPADGGESGLDDAPDADALREFCRERLAGFKLPRTIAFARSLPRTASGTVDREAVREHLSGATD